MGVRRIALFVLCGVAATAAAAPPQVEIRAQTKLALDKVRLLSDDRAEIRGQLLDNLTGEGIGQQTVTLKIGDESVTARTEQDGRFRVTVAVTAGPQPVDVEFEGGPLLGSSQLTQITDPARAQVELSLEIEDAPGGKKLVVHATADDEPIQLPIVLSAGAPADEQLGVLARMRSDEPYHLTRAAAGGPGTRRLRATFAGDELRQAAASEKTIELGAASKTTMTVSTTRLAYEDELDITGKVIDEDGHALARAAVTLASGDRRLAQGATAEDGSYRFQVEGEVLGRGQWGIQVQAAPGHAAVKPSRSPPAIIQVAAPQPVPVSYTIAAFLATGCAAGGFFMARARPWRRIRRSTPPADRPTAPAHDEPLDGGLAVARPSLVSSLRRPADDGFSGAVHDAVRGRPVEGAEVRLRLAEAERTARTGPDGSFAFDALPAGDWLAEVWAPAHVTERFVVSIPHRGELRGVRVDLVPVRERVFQLYRRAAEPVLPEPRLWGVWSPRQIVDHVRGKRPSPALAELTDFVEEVYFSARSAEETVLPGASEQVDRAIRERARAAV